MGNISSCFYPQSNTSKLIDLRRSTIRLVGAPITAAELMLEEPGHVISPVNDLRHDFRLSAMKADENLSVGRVYVLIPVSRINGKVTESEMAVIESACGRRRAKRRSTSRDIPVVTEISGEGNDNWVKLFGEESDADSGVLNYRMRQWKPSLGPIYEGI